MVARTSFPSKYWLFTVVACGALSTTARADELDTFQFFAGQSVQRDSNVFRLSGATQSDTIGVTTLGVKFDKPLGLQRFELTADVQDHRYNRNSFLDFTGINYAGAWRWSITPNFRGNLTADRKEYVDNSPEAQSTSQLNRRTERSTVLDAEYGIDGPWRLLGGVFNRKYTNSQPSFEGDSETRGAEAGVRYGFSSGSALSYRFRQGNGDYSARVALPGFSGSFKEREHEVRYDRALTGKTSLQTRIAHLERKHDRIAARDFSGVVGEATVNYAVTAKTSVAGGFARNLGSYQANDASYFQENRVFLAPAWKPTVKTAFRLRYDYGVRRYKGALPGVQATGRRDKTHLAGLTFEWEPIRAITLTAFAQRDQRNSNVPGSDYRASVLGLSALARF